MTAMEFGSLKLAELLNAMESDTRAAATRTAPAKWACSVCTFLNVEPLAACEVCGSLRPLQPKIAVPAAAARHKVALRESDEAMTALREAMTALPRVSATAGGATSGVGKGDLGAAAACAAPKPITASGTMMYEGGVLRKGAALTNVSPTHSYLAFPVPQLRALPSP